MSSTITPFFTLLKREILRYVKNPIVTIAPPIISQILYILVFGLVLGPRIGSVGEYTYISFMFPGLVMMALLMNSFMNPSWSMYAGRHFGWIEPILSSPLSHIQIATGYILGGVIRGLFVGTILLGGAYLLPGIPILHSIPYVLIYFLVVSFLAASGGCIVGLWAQKFDHIALIMNFALFPLVFLGGVFYSLEMEAIQGILKTIIKLNPVTHMINGLRYGMIGMTDINLLPGLVFLPVIALAFFAMSVKLIQKGYNLRD
ncbi:hypothetical protein AKJ49_01600 [candidate division MSBL1 archaeon SCGC-AAA382A03]|uniref:ABC transmembrane type-2 domain-containing protein n=1 Tax=candidate division MSBL1 archaeon SCGC-AAA382A03 TaxID=1698278 RepID=A0A133VEL9_9EURY|nr:hypothetical protein AKJ49_01600 [candidate division MSBL1 archaeon SCGC-AAA382A03]